MKTNSTIKKIFAMLLACATMLALRPAAQLLAPALSKPRRRGRRHRKSRNNRAALTMRLLDEIANAIAARFDEMNAAGDVKVEYSISSGQNDQTILKRLCDQAIADKVDIVPIATTAAQVATLSAEGTGVRSSTPQYPTLRPRT